MKAVIGKHLNRQKRGKIYKDVCKCIILIGVLVAKRVRTNGVKFNNSIVNKGIVNKNTKNKPPYRCCSCEKCAYRSPKDLISQ